MSGAGCSITDYARDLVRAHGPEITGISGRLSRRLQTVLAKAIAAVWKASSLSPLPIFTFHRASFLHILGREDEAKRLYATFVKEQTAFRPDQIDELLMTHEGYDVQHALSRATQWENPKEPLRH